MQTAAILPQLATAAAPARTIGSDSRAFAPAMEQASSAIGQKGQRASDSGSDLAGAVNAQAEKGPSATPAPASGAEATSVETAPSAADSSATFSPAAPPETVPTSELGRLSAGIDVPQAMVVANNDPVPATGSATVMAKTSEQQGTPTLAIGQNPAATSAAVMAETAEPQGTPALASGQKPAATSAAVMAETTEPQGTPALASGQKPTATSAAVMAETSEPQGIPALASGQKPTATSAAVMAETSEPQGIPTLAIGQKLAISLTDSTAKTQPMEARTAEQPTNATTSATPYLPSQTDSQISAGQQTARVGGELQPQHMRPESAPQDDSPWQMRSQQPEILQSVIARSSANNSASLSSSKTSRPRIDDPRFASLLAPQQTPSLRQQTGENPSLMAVPAPAPSPIGPTESPAEGKLTATTSTPSADQAFDNSLLTMSQGNSDITGTEFSHPADRQNPSAVASSLQKGPAATPTSAGDSLLLRDGSPLPASRVITQTIEHLSVHARGDSSVVTVKLHPEELGELQLRLVMEGDQLRVQLHTQHQQVQDVLERNFPRLRDALQDQGLTIEDFQVSLDNGQNPQRDFGASSDRQWQGQGFQQVTSDEPENVPTVIAAQALSGRNASGSLSLRV